MKSRENIKKVVIIGAGNVLLSDDGVGIHVIKELEKDPSFEGVSFVDIGTSSFDIGMHLSEDTDKIVIIDSIRTSEFAAGTVFRLTLKDLRKRQKESYSLHQVELIDSLKLHSVLNRLPEMIILGVVPADVNTFSMELSGKIKKDFDSIVLKIKKEIIDFFNTDA